MVNHMVKYNESSLDRTFNALSDRTRRGILSRLAEGEAVVTELAAPFNMSLPAISKHLGVLEHAGLISRVKDGRIRRCELQAGPLAQAAQWVDFYRHFWESRLDSLANFLEKTDEGRT